MLSTPACLIPGTNTRHQTVYNLPCLCSSSSIKISWRAPDQSEVNGEFLGYQLSWRERGGGGGGVTTGGMASDSTAGIVLATVVVTLSPDTSHPHYR